MSYERSFKPPSQRQLRVGELIRHALSDLLRRGDIGDPALDALMVSVSQVKMSPDLKIATVLVQSLKGDADKAAMVKCLASHAKIMRQHVAHEVALKYAPELRFRYDESLAAIARIEDLLRGKE